jgi:hypothetical protein
LDSGQASQDALYTIMDKGMTLSEKSHDPEENLRWLAWEEKNRREQWSTDPLPYCLECGKSLKPA